MTVPALWTKHRQIAYGVANQYFLQGADREDVEQEALVALWLAARDYDPARGPFKPYAALWVHRRLQDKVKAAGRLKHRQLTFAVSLDDVAPIEDPKLDVPRAVEARERLREAAAS